VFIRLEDGGTVDARQVENPNPDREVDGEWIGEATFAVPEEVPLGYHRIVLRSLDREVESALIVTPSWLGFPRQMGDKRIWGFATQLYSVASHDSWGVGDLTDLADMAVWSATKHFASYVLINPLHAAEPVAPMEPSPYLPSSRRYVNPLYIRPRRSRSTPGCRPPSATPSTRPDGSWRQSLPTPYASSATPHGTPSGKRSSWFSAPAARPHGRWRSRTSSAVRTPAA